MGLGTNAGIFPFEVFKHEFAFPGLHRESV
jgi:hypothetical protein